MDNVHKVDYSGEKLYNVLMEKNDTMIINNMTVKTMHPKNIVAKLYTKKYNEKEKNKLITDINSKVHNY